MELSMYGCSAEFSLPSGLLPAWSASCFGGHTSGDDVNEGPMVEKPKSKKKERDWLTVPEACDIAGVSANTIKTWATVYGIGLKVGGRFRINPTELDKVLRGEA